ncbi:MAG TPA: PAS domain S-box protein [Nitrospira sp.]|nr:PAS domain S-box protein [Nitrospira sp.]
MVPSLNHPVNRYGVAVATVAVATALRFALHLWIPTGAPFLTYFLAVMFAAWHGGLGPGLFASLLSVVTASFFFVQPAHTLAITPNHVVSIEAACIAMLTERFRCAEERFTKFMRHLPGLAWIKDPDGRYIFVNDAAETAFGIPKASLYGKSDDEIFPPRTAAQFKMNDRKVLESATSVQTIERLEQQDGWHDSVVHKFAIPLAHNREMMVAGIAIDITEYRRAEIALRESEARFRIMADTAPVMVWMSDTTALCTWFNQAWLDFTGRTMKQELGNGWADLVHPEDVDRCVALYRSAFDKREQFKMEYRLRRHDGQYRWVLDHGIPRYAGDEEFVGYIGSCIDVTERREAEEAVRQSEERLLGLVTTAMDAIVTVNSNHVITLFNPAAEQMFKCGAQEALGQSLDRFIPPRFRAAHARHVAEFGGTGVTSRRMGPSGMACGLRADGEEFPIEASISQVKVKGEVRFTVIVRDITRRKQSEEQLRASEARFRELVERSPFGIYIVDGRFRISHMNETAQQGAFRNIRPVIGRDFSEAVRTLWPAPVADDILGVFRHTLKTGEPYYSRDFVNARADSGQIEGYEWELHRISLPEGEQGVICYYYDSTKLREAQAALQEAQVRLERWNADLESAVKEKTAELVQTQERLRALATELNLAEQRERKRLAVYLHDELAQLLVLSRMKLNQAERALERPPDAREFIKDADNALVDALTSTRRVVSDLAPPVLHDLGLPSALKWLADYMKRYEIDVTVTVPPDDRIRLPEEQAVLLFQSVRELLMNSFKHGRSGEAFVTMTRKDKQLRIEVRDQGQGFASNDASTAEIGSSHFGLFSIRERMRALGGSFRIESKPGHGTTAVLSLGLEGALSTVSRDPRRTHHAIPPRGPQTDQRIQVLLVDDHAMVREGLRRVLEGYDDIEVLGEACNGEEAVSAVTKYQPTVVVMDFNMPKMNGAQATEFIKARHPTTVVIGLSVQISDQSRSAMIGAGAVTVITKEAAVGELYQAIKDAVAK